MTATLNERARFARERAGFSTPQAAADAIGCSRPTVIRWEDDPAAISIGGKYLNNAARAYKVRPEWLQLQTDDDGFPWHVDRPSPSPSQSTGLDVGKLADLLGTVEAAVEKARIKLPPMVKARLVATLYADKEASAAASAQAVQAALVGILATMETNDEPTAAR